MPYSTPAERAQARAQVKKAEQLGGGISVAVRALAVISAGQVAVAGSLTVAGPPGILIACLLLVEKMFELWAQDARGTLSDPPRTDYELSSRVRPRPFYPYAFGASPLEETAVAMADELNRAAALLRATITARERAWGAREADAPAWERERLREAAGLARAAGSTLQGSTEHSMAFAGLVEAHPLRAPARQHEVRIAASLLPDDTREEMRWLKRGMETYLPADALALLFRAGIRIELLRRPLPRIVSEDPLGTAADELRAAADVARHYAETLERVSGEATF